MNGKIKRATRRAATRMRRGGRAGLGAGIATATLSGTAIGAAAATGASVPAVLVFGGAVVSTMVGGVVAWRKGRSQHVPEGLLDNRDESYTAAYCTYSTLREADLLTEGYYRNEYVSPEVAEAWRLKNPKGFVHILNCQSELCGAFGILALEKSFMAQFKKGRVRDNIMIADDVLPYEEALQARDLYVSGVVVRDPDTMTGHRRAAVLLWVMATYLRKHYGTRKQGRRIYALAVSPSSENLLRAFDFAIESPATERADGLNLYSTQLTRRLLDRIVARTGNFSLNCSCSFP